ncbi:hypothetical protein PHMEG_00041477, partial [Phytophthora megakarya]
MRHGSPTQVELVHVVEAQETRNADQKTIQTQEKVQAMAFSACGEFIAIADAAGTLSLYKSNGTLLFGHRVVRDGSSDRVVSMAFATSKGMTSSSDSQDLVVVTTSGMLLRLGDLRLEEFEQLLLENPKNALSVILRNIQFERTNVGKLMENATSCML